MINRNSHREDAIRKAGPDSLINFLPWDSEISFQEFDLVVNTTPGETASVFCNQKISVGTTYFEALYNPWPTQLLSHWRNSGGYGIDGLDLLIHQAISQIQIFSGRTFDRSAIARTLRIEGEKAL